MHTRTRPTDPRAAARLARLARLAADGATARAPGSLWAARAQGEALLAERHAARLAARWTLRSLFGIAPTRSLR